MSAFRRANKTLAILLERYPDCFYGYERNPKPLKISIFQDLVAADVAPLEDLSITLSQYTRNLYYLRACKVGAVRVGLDGQPAGEVSAAHAEQARCWVMARLEREMAAAKIKRDAAKAAHNAANTGYRARKAPDLAPDARVVPAAPVAPIVAVAPAAPPVAPARAILTAPCAPGRRPVLTLPSLRKRARLAPDACGLIYL